MDIIARRAWDSNFIIPRLPEFFPVSTDQCWKVSSSSTSFSALFHCSLLQPCSSFTFRCSGHWRGLFYIISFFLIIFSYIKSLLIILNSVLHGILKQKSWNTLLNLLDSSFKPKLIYFKKSWFCIITGHCLFKSWKKSYSIIWPRDWPVAALGFCWAGLQ